MDENKVSYSDFDYNFVKIWYKLNFKYQSSIPSFSTKNKIPSPISINLMFSDTVKVWTAIHTTIDACANTSAICNRALMPESQGRESCIFRQLEWMG